MNFVNKIVETVKKIDKKTWLIIGAVALALVIITVVLCLVFGGKNNSDELIGGKTVDEIMSMTEEELNSFVAELESAGEIDNLVSQAEPVAENVNEDAVQEKEDITTQVIEQSFPMTTENGMLKIHSLQKYNGYFIEDGSNIATENAIGIIVENISTKDILFARIELKSDKTEENAIFEMSFIPAGEKVFVQERNNRKLVDGEKFSYEFCKLTEMDYTEYTQNFKDMIDTGYTRRPESNCIIIYNKTDKALSGKVFYKQKKDGMLYGGKTFATTLPSPILSGNSMYISVYHYNQDSVVVAAKLSKEDIDLGVSE